MFTQLNTLRDAIHTNAVEKGFYDEAHHDTHYLTLIIEEIGEAISADRKGQRANTEAYQDAINTHHRPIEEAYATYIKGSLEEEIADICIRLLDFAGHKQVDLSLTEEEVKETEGQIELFNEQANKVESPLTNALFVMSTDLYNLYICSITRDNEGMKVFVVKNINFLNALANYLDFDLLYHIQQKMTYNATRPRLHGKKY